MVSYIKSPVIYCCGVYDCRRLYAGHIKCFCWTWDGLISQKLLKKLPKSRNNGHFGSSFGQFLILLALLAIKKARIWLLKSLCVLSKACRPYRVLFLDIAWPNLSESRQHQRKMAIFSRFFPLFVSFFKTYFLREFSYNHIRNLRKISYRLIYRMVSIRLETRKL